MSHPPAPDPPFEYVVVRVDVGYPQTWFAGYDENYRARVTRNENEAVRMKLDQARLAVYSTRLDRGGVWGIRKVQDQGA